MPHANDTEKIIFQNLVDAGCDGKTIKLCMEKIKSGYIDDILPLLLKHRSNLRNTVRKGQKQIDALDFLIFKIQKHD